MVMLLPSAFASTDFLIVGFLGGILVAKRKEQKQLLRVKSKYPNREMWFEKTLTPHLHIYLIPCEHLRSLYEDDL